MAKSMIARIESWSVAALALPLVLGCGRANLASEAAVGRPCDLTVDAGPREATYNAAAAECPTHLCSKPTVQAGATPPTPPTVPTCTAECSQDSDCEGGELRDSTNSLDGRCAKGFACAVPYEIGPLCCKKLCVCKDFLPAQGGATPIACQNGGNLACDNGNGTATGPVGVVTTASVTLAPVRQLDLVTLIDTSPSMAPKIAKFNAAFPKLIDALKNRDDGTLPDLRVAIIDADLGTGEAKPPLCPPKTLADGTYSLSGDMGRFLVPSSPVHCAVDPGTLFLEYRAGLPVNYSGELGSVFSCLTGNLGTSVCSEKQPLQSLQFALTLGGVGNEAQRAAFLRPTAELGLIVLSDEDDCSAAANDGLFTDDPALHDESRSLRCATRAHQCGGQNLADTGPHYPTVASYAHPFSDCAARQDACPNPADGTGHTDTSKPTSCAPFDDVHAVASQIKALKADPDHQITVAGIFGWPRSTAELAAAVYKIAPVPNPNPADTAHPTLFDYWPVCYDPNHLPSPATTDPATGFDATAAAWGATGGLREASFVEQFGSNGLRFSICEPDFDNAMTTIGTAMQNKLQSVCLDAKLLDADAVTPGLQPDCRAAYALPVGGDPFAYSESPTSLPLCPSGAINGNVSEDCWQITKDTVGCPVNGQHVVVLRTAQEIERSPQLPAGVKVRISCRTCPDAVSAAGCDY